LIVAIVAILALATLMLLRGRNGVKLYILRCVI